MPDKKKETSLKKPEKCIDPPENECCSAISFKEQRLILSSISSPKYYNFFYFCCCTGVRVCEALSVKTKNINKRKRVITIDLKDTKTKKHERDIPFLPELVKDMDLSSKYLFPDITDEGSKQYFQRLYKDLNLELCRHSTRHTFISICGFIGIDEEIIQEWAGHTDIKMTVNTYTHQLKNGTSPVLDYLKKLKRSLKL